jgi:CRP/FNR family transcriptional regulator
MTTTADTPKLRLEPFKVACSSCNLRELCLPWACPTRSWTGSTPWWPRAARWPAGTPVPHQATRSSRCTRCAPASSRPACRRKMAATRSPASRWPANCSGLDGIGTDRHTCDAVALEDSQVCVIPYDQLEDLSREFSDLQHQFHKIMSREIVRDHGVMLLLGSMRAEERLAAFLLNLTQRLQARGFSASALILRMTREEIGSYLGLKLETVSRTFSSSRTTASWKSSSARSASSTRTNCSAWSTAPTAERPQRPGRRWRAGGRQCRNAPDAPSRLMCAGSPASRRQQAGRGDHAPEHEERQRVDRVSTTGAATRRPASAGRRGRPTRRPASPARQPSGRTARMAIRRMRVARGGHGGSWFDRAAQRGAGVAAWLRPASLASAAPAAAPPVAAWVRR